MQHPLTLGRASGGRNIMSGVSIRRQIRLKIRRQIQINRGDKYNSTNSNHLRLISHPSNKFRTVPGSKCNISFSFVSIHIYAYVRLGFWTIEEDWLSMTQLIKVGFFYSLINPCATLMVSYHLLLPRHWIMNDGQQCIRRGSTSLALKNFAIIYIVLNAVVKDSPKSPTQTLS